MARLSDIPKVYRSVGVIPFIYRVYDEMNKDNLLVWASALAYSWLFAIFPFFIFLLALMPYMPQRAQDVTQREIKLIISDQLPSMANSMLLDRIGNSTNLAHQRAGGKIVVPGPVHRAVGRQQRHLNDHERAR